jgi:serine/threonine-protein kinase ULK4
LQNPSARFTYEAVRQHPFLHGNTLPAVSFPSQPQYENFVRLAEARRAAPAQAAKETGAVAKENRRNGEAVDAVRLSQIARRNVDKEKSGDTYRCADATAAALADGNGGDVHLSNPNEELDFSEDCAQAERADSAQAERADAGASDEDELGARDEKETFDDGSLSAAVQTIRPATPKIDWPRKHDAPRPHTDPSVYGKERPADEPSMAHTQVAPQPPAAMCDSLMAMREGLARDDERALRQSFSDTTSRLGCAQVDDLVLHTSDLTVRPIVPNKKEDVKVVDAKLLPFEALAIEGMLQLQQTELEKFLTDIYRSVGGHTSVGEKLNTLLYIETLCSDGRFCNLVCNSSLMQLFVKMVKSCKSPMLKAKLAYVIGLLIRHATFVSSELQRSGIIETFTELMSDVNEKVKRRAMGTLGELLFYAATQHLEPAIEGQPNEKWEIPPATIALVVGTIAPKQDELTQLYAVKTIDNIAAQSEEYAQTLARARASAARAHTRRTHRYARKFATAEVFQSLYLIVRDSKNDSLRAAAASALPRLCRYNRALTSTAYEKATTSSFVALLADPNARVQLGVLNLINMLLLDGSTPAGKRVRDDADFVPQLMKLLEHSTAAIRAKGLIAVQVRACGRARACVRGCGLSAVRDAQLLVRSDAKALLKCCEAKLIVFVDRISKDKDDYIFQCLRSLQVPVGRDTAGVGYYWVTAGYSSACGRCRTRWRR